MFYHHNKHIALLLSSELFSRRSRATFFQTTFEWFLKTQWWNMLLQEKILNLVHNPWTTMFSGECKSDWKFSTKNTLFWWWECRKRLGQIILREVCSPGCPWYREALVLHILHEKIVLYVKNLSKPWYRIALQLYNKWCFAKNNARYR